MTSECVLMLGLLDNDKHYLMDFYKEALTSHLDIINAIRINLFTSNDHLTLSGNFLLTQYGYSENLFANISGELVLIIVYLVITIFIKVGGAVLQF